MLGSGGIMVINDTVSIPELALRTIEFYAHESCGQCTPCREGSHVITEKLRALVAGNGTNEDIDLILHLCANITGPYPVPDRRSLFGADPGDGHQIQAGIRSAGQIRIDYQEENIVMSKTIFIDGKEIAFDGNKTVLQVARENGIYIPSLCYHPKLGPASMCRVCVVEVEGMRAFRPPAP